MTVPASSLVLARLQASRGFETPTHCALCGRPVERGTGPTPRLRHPACTRFVNFLAATLRAVADMRDLECRRMARRHLIAAANKLPARWSRPRSPQGRFQSPAQLASTPGVGASAGAGAQGARS
jgi:hypothetical protein